MRPRREGWREKEGGGWKDRAKSIDATKMKTAESSERKSKGEREREREW